MSERTCSIPECGRGVLARGLCGGHYQRQREGRPVDGPLRPHGIPQGKICTVEGCFKPPVSRGWCAMHYTRWLRHGDPLKLKPLTAIQKFWRDTVRTDGCWFWVGSITKGGYGLTARGRGRGNQMAHRFAYELLVGPIPEGLEVDHLCNNPRCVRPEHLEPVTPEENMRRSVERRNLFWRTRCPQGHTTTGPESYYIYEKKNGRKQHVCKQCASDRQRSYKRRKRELRTFA